MTTRRNFIRTFVAAFGLYSTGLISTVYAAAKQLMSLQLRSKIRSDGKLELSLVPVEIPEPGADEVIVRIEATPINPSDMLLLFGPADLNTAVISGKGINTVLTADIPDNLMQMVAGRTGMSLPAGYEGAGTVVNTGSSAAARALKGRTVAMMGSAMFSQYRRAKAGECLVLPEGTSPAEGASCFVNPLTVLAMVETMRMEGHKAMIHTAAASNLGQMLNRHCINENVDLVNIVRRQEQVDLLKSMGASYVCNSSLPTFMDDLTDAIMKTGATIAFDAVGGGNLSDQILTCMENAAVKSGAARGRYGSSAPKQVYIYGSLDRSPTVLSRNFGVGWNVGIWLMPNFLQKIGGEATQKLKEKVAAEIKTTFASSYAREVSLVEALQPEVISVYSKQATGMKYLLNPNK